MAQGEVLAAEAGFDLTVEGAAVPTCGNICGWISKRRSIIITFLPKIVIMVSTSDEGTLRRTPLNFRAFIGSFDLAELITAIARSIRGVIIATFRGLINVVSAGKKDTDIKIRSRAFVA